MSPVASSPLYIWHSAIYLRKCLRQLMKDQGSSRNGSTQSLCIQIAGGRVDCYQTIDTGGRKMMSLLIRNSPVFIGVKVQHGVDLNRPCAGLSDFRLREDIDFFTRRKLIDECSPFVAR